jgi:hypothetical protein
MTELLDRAFVKASKLPEREQNALAEWLLDELDSDERWRRTIADSHDRLAGLAREARAEHREGRTRELNPETL